MIPCAKRCIRKPPKNSFGHDTLYPSDHHASGPRFLLSSEYSDRQGRVQPITAGMIVVNQGLLERDKLQRHPVGQGEPEVAMIKAIKFASVPVSDQDRALDFYTQKLGFEVATDIPFDDNQRWIELRIQDSETRLVLFTPRGQEDRIGSFSNIVFVSDDVEETYRELVARGVEFVQEPKKADWGTAAVLRDPDGNSFVISSE